MLKNSYTIRNILYNNQECFLDPAIKYDIPFCKKVENIPPHSWYIDIFYENHVKVCIPGMIGHCKKLQNHNLTSNRETKSSKLSENRNLEYQ